jgi:hypothetical protein
VLFSEANRWNGSLPGETDYGFRVDSEVCCGLCGSQERFEGILGAVRTHAGEYRLSAVDLDYLARIFFLRRADLVSQLLSN